MKSSNLEKAYPELKGFPFDEQRKILEKAKDEIKKGKTVFLGTKGNLACLIIFLIIAVILSFVLPSDDWGGGMLSGWRLLISLALLALIGFKQANNRAIKVLRPKVRELVQKEI